MRPSPKESKEDIDREYARAIQGATTLCESEFNDVNSVSDIYDGSWRPALLEFKCPVDSEADARNLKDLIEAGL